MLRVKKGSQFAFCDFNIVNFEKFSSQVNLRINLLFTFPKEKRQEICSFVNHII